jgi:hypothetical protein
VTSGSARSHSRLRASGRGDLLARRGKGMSDAEAARTLKALERDDSGVPVAEAIAAFVRLHPDWPDDEIAQKVRGCDDPAEVARVRGRLAAGRTAEHSGSGAASGPPAPASHPAPTGAAWAPGAADPPPPVESPPSGPRGCAAILEAMPSYSVVAPDGTTTEHPTYQSARLARARTGGRITAISRTTPG